MVSPTVLLKNAFVFLKPTNLYIKLEGLLGPVWFSVILRFVFFSKPCFKMPKVTEKRFQLVQNGRRMIAVDQLRRVQIFKLLPDDHEIWRHRRALISKIIPPSNCMHSTILKYKDFASFKTSMNLLYQHHPVIYAESQRLLARALAQEPHHCTLDEWINNGLFFVVFHLHQVKKNLLCLPELLFPDTPIEDYLAVLRSIGGAGSLSPSALEARDLNRNWGGINWRSLESLVSSPTNSRGLARDEPEQALCGAQLM